MKPNLILLHGAIGCKKQLQPLAESLEDKFNVYTFNFSGHGGENIPDDDLSIESFSSDLIRFINENGIQNPVSIFGYSMGGYVSLYTAFQNPDLIDRIVTLATKFDWNPETSARESAMLNVDKMEQKIPAFAAYLKELHHPQDWKLILSKTAKMLMMIGEKPPLKKSDFLTIKNKILITIGDLDKMVSVSESRTIADLLPNGNFQIMQNVEHPIEKIPVELLSKIIAEFILGGGITFKNP